MEEETLTNCTVFI